MFGEPGAVAAGSLDPDPQIIAKPHKPRREPLVSVLVGRHGEFVEYLSEPVQCYGDVLVLVRVHSRCDHELPPHLSLT